MEERYITIYKKGELVGLIVFHKSFGFLVKKMVVYIKKGTRFEIERFKALLSEGYTNISTMREKLLVECLNSEKRGDLFISGELEFVSEMKNETMRNKRTIGESYKNFERWAFKLDTKTSGRLRQR